MVSFFAALLPTELSHKFLALNAGVAYWLLVVRKAKKTPVLAGWVGSLAGFVQCVVLVRLAQMYQSNISAKRSIRDTLAEQSDIPKEKLTHIGDLSLRNWLSVMLPLPQSLALSLSYPGVQNVGTIVYATVGKNTTTKLKMDVYTSQTTCKPSAPIFLYIHGGGWVMGDRKNAPQPLIHQVAALGWVVCVIDYRLSPKVAFPEHLIDSKRAVAFLREHGHSHPLLAGADPSFIVVGGESAGGHLASLVALTAGDKTLQPGFEDVDTSVRGCIDTYGVHDFKDRHGIYFYKDKGYSFIRFLELVVMQKKLKESSDEYDQASPMSWVQADSGAVNVPPFLISHGTHDTLVPFQDSVLFFENLQKHRQRTSAALKTTVVVPGSVVEDVFLEIPDAHHAFNYLVSPRALAHGEAICAFLENLYEKTRHLPLSSSSAGGAQARGAAASTLTKDGAEDPLASFSLAATTTVSRL